MKSEDWEKAKRIFADAIKRPPAERVSFLDEVCADNPKVRHEVESLLASFDESESFMETAAARQISGIAKPVGMKLEEGSLLGHYEIIEQLGTGGMGEVYLARDTKLDRRVAVKVLNEKFSRHESNLQRFIREAKAASALNHPNILIIHEIGETEEANYIVSEYVEGETLRERLKRQPLRLHEVLDISIQIAGALAAAHAAHIVHRDIKPENIMIRPDGYVKILDFGLAKLVEQKPVGLEESAVRQNQTARGLILGTVSYMSPEQAKGEPVDGRTDIFSLGATVYEMITGRTPFEGDSASETFANLIKAEPAPLSRYASNVPEEMQRIISKALDKNADKRYRTMKDALDDLKDLRENLSFEEKKERFASSDDHLTRSLRGTTDEANGQTGKTHYSFQQIKNKKPIAAVALLALLVGAIGLGYYFWTTKTFSGAGGKKTLAVLPFVNAGKDPNAEYLSDGITESIINNLSQLSDLKVMSRNSTFRFRDNQADTRNIASQLGVEYIITGDIRHVGERFVINVRLINAEDDSQTWGNQYVKTASDIIATQNEIARDVSRSLGARLTGADERKLAKKLTDNAEAYELYLKGEYFLAKAQRSDAEKAIEYFQQAVALDPNFAMAYLGLASAHAFLTGFIDVPQENLRPKAREYTLKAASLDDGLPEVHEALAGMYLSEYRFADAEREYRRAIELNPNSADAGRGYAYLLTIFGRHDESLAEVRRSLELDPISLSANTAYGTSLFYARRYDEAIAHLKKVLELDPDFFPAHYGLAIAYEMKGDYAASVAERVKMNELGGTRQRAEAIQKSFDQGGWEGFLREATADNASFNVPPYIAVGFNAALGEKDKAFAILEKLYEKRSGELTAIKVDPRLDNLRDDPRFQDLMRRIGLPQ